MKKIVFSLMALFMIFAVSCNEAGKKEDEKTNEEKKAVDVTGKYDFVKRSDGKDLLNYHTIEINEDGTYKESYQPKGDTYVGGTEGTWKLDDKQLTLTDNGGINVEYVVDGSKITRTSDNGVSFEFVKK